MKIVGLFRKIGTRIFASFTLLLVILVSLMSFLGLQFAEKTISANAANELRLLSVVLSRQVQRQLIRIEESMTSMENHGFLIEQLATPTPDRQAIDQFLQERMRLLPLFDDFAVYDRKGNCIGATSPSWYTISAKQKAFYVYGLKGFNFSDIFTSDEGKIQLVSTPINNGSVTKGVFVGQVNMSSIYDVMGQKLGLSESTDAFILDGALRFITPGKTGIDKLLESHLVATTLKRHLKEEFWVDRYKNFDGADVLGTVFRIPGRRWYVVVERDLKEVRRPIDDAKKVVLGASLLLLVLLIFTTYFLSRSITRPLLVLVDSTQRIAAGDFKQSVLIPKGLDEVAFLAAEIDKMRARIAAFQERMRERLQESERKRIENERLAAIGTMASTLAHEIRNPLNGMSLLVSRLELKQGTSTAQTGVIDDLRGEIGRLDRLVSEILDYARPITLHLDDVNLGPLLEGSIELLRGSFDAKGMGATLILPHGEVRARADGDRIKQCVVNLLRNAAEASTTGGHVDVEADIIGVNVVITVRDTGSGIKPETVDRLFDLFFTTKDTGTGLGLSTVKKMVEAHGGQISLVSRSDGVCGTEARLSFPITPMPEHSPVS